MTTLAVRADQAVAPASAVRGFLNDVIWDQPMPETLPLEFLWLYFVLPALLIAPATVLTA